MPPVPSLAELAARALPSADRDLIRQNVIDLPENTQMGYLAAGNHQFRRLIRIFIHVRNAAANLLLGYVPVSQWNTWPGGFTLHDITPTTTDNELRTRLYKNANYEFTHRVRRRTGVFAQPMKIVGLLIQGPYIRLFLQYVWDGIVRIRGWILNATFSRIRFHSRP